MYATRVYFLPKGLPRKVPSFLIAEIKRARARTRAVSYLSLSPSSERPVSGKPLFYSFNFYDIKENKERPSIRQFLAVMLKRKRLLNSLSFLKILHSLKTKRSIDTFLRKSSHTHLECLAHLLYFTISGRADPPRGTLSLIKSKKLKIFSKRAKTLFSSKWKIKQITNDFLILHKAFVFIWPLLRVLGTNFVFIEEEQDG